MEKLTVEGIKEWYDYDLGYAVENYDDDELEKLYNDYPILQDYLCNFHPLGEEMQEHGIAETIINHSHLLEGCYIVGDGLYIVDEAIVHPWRNWEKAEYASQLTEEQQKVVRMIVTGYVYTELADYTEEEKQQAIETAMNSRLVDLCDAEIVRDMLMETGIL